jgi:hypothetical protein
MVCTNDNTWLIDSGASRHMTSLRNHLTHFVEKETHLHVVLGDDARYNVRGVGDDARYNVRGEYNKGLAGFSSLVEKGFRVHFLCTFAWCFFL